MIIQENDIFIDTKGNLQKCLRIIFFSKLYKENLYEFHTGKMEYELTVLKEWKKTNLNYIPGEQIKLFV